jgi:protein kinase-like protein
MDVYPPVDIGTDFLGYRIEEVIGRGGMGVVYRAYDLRLKRPVAVKLIVPELALDERFHARFARETELAMSLEHPNVVPVYDAGDVEGHFYLTMRLVEGTDLGALLRSEGALDQARALAICSQVASALDAAHVKGLVHRDVKPSNVLLDASEHAYLADFGLTRRLDEQGGSAGEGRSVGTPAYLAPEQIEGGSVDGRADVYALGCLVYECLTGETPFAGSRLEVAWAHLEEEAPSAKARRTELPEAIDAVIRKAMAKEPDDRYSTCGALTAAAEEALGLRRPPAARRQRLWVVAAVATLLLVAALLVAALVLRDPSGAGAAPVVAPDTLVRIDPATSKVEAVVDVGLKPSATAVGGRSVWVYSSDGSSVSEIDAATTDALHTTEVTGRPGDLGASAGPVLAADRGGAWLVGVDLRGRALLTRILTEGRGKRVYVLDHEPRAVGVGYGAVWVVLRDARDSQVLRIDPDTGEVDKRTRFSASSPIDGLAVGLGSVWVVASSTGMLYRIDPRSAHVTGRVDLLAHDLLARAARPVVALGSIWVGLSDSGGGTRVVDPRTLSVRLYLDCCPLEWGYFTAGFGSVWLYDMPTGNVVRWDGQTHDSDSVVHLTDPPFYKGMCLTSIAAGAGAVWVTVAANLNYHC